MVAKAPEFSRLLPKRVAGGSQETGILQAPAERAAMMATRELIGEADEDHWIAIDCDRPGRGFAGWMQRADH